ncbi:ATP-binding protein [Streptomyces sp. NPDC001250]|uniref:ATP-binding protein n=1 Tax=unclassified Streptomyces TaxID=2593676 RepID=UPI00331BC838
MNESPALPRTIIVNGFFRTAPATETADQHRPAEIGHVPPERHHPVVEHRDEYPLPHHATAAAEARRHARQVLAGWGLAEDVVFDALLVVSELVTNAVEHALPPVALCLRTSAATDGPAAVRINVTDGGPAPQDGAWTRSCAADEHGRGQQIVNALAEHTSARRCGHGSDYGATLQQCDPIVVEVAA